MRPTSTLALLLGFTAAAHPRPAAAQAVVITGASVIDPSAADPVTQGTVVVERGLVTAVGPSARAPVGATVIDGRGKFVVPGLWDMHAHLAALGPIDSAPERYVGYGVLNVRDMGGYPDSLLPLRAAILAGRRVGPQIVLAGPTLNSDQPAPFHRKLLTGAEARAAVRELKAMGVDFIKIHRGTNREVFDAIADETRRLGLTFCGHVPLVMGWIDASNAGMRTIEHIQTIFENEQPDPQQMAAHFSEIADRFDGPHGDSIFAVLVRNHTYFDPTLVGYEHTIENAGLRVAELRRLAYARMKPIAARAAHDGVRILAGTDVLERHGEMLLLELERLVEVGLTPQQALAAATTTAAEAAQRPESGYVRPGAPASFLVLDANPLQDIRNLRALSLVVLRGTLIPRATGSRSDPATPR